MSMMTVTVSEKGWIVIPKEIREKYGIKKGDKIRILDLGGELTLLPVPPGDPIERGLGMFKGGPTMADFLADKRRELANEERDLPPPRPLE
jgi:AbrB family looped-hinge helix DNA binding protein